MTTRTRGSVFSVGIDYADGPHPYLPDAPSDARLLEAFFSDWGFHPLLECCLLSDATARAVVDSLERWVDTARDEKRAAKVVLYLAGHGRLHNGRHYVLVASSPETAPYFGSKAISVEDLVQAILNSGALSGLILLDTCYAGFAAHEVQQAVDRAAAAHGGPGMDLAVLVPSLHHERSYSGLFVKGMLEALRTGSRGGHWNDGDEFVTLLELRDELRLRLSDDQCAYVAGRDGMKIVPNPRYRAHAADRAVELGALLADLPDADREHFLSRAASADAGDVGWYFTGRERMTRRVTGWLSGGDRGVLVVTGPPGCGKSAFLGRMAVLADHASQPACRVLGLLDEDRARPPVGSFDAVVHLRNRRAEEVARDIGDQLGLDLSGSTSPPRDLITLLSDGQRAVTVLADALDEAEQDDAVYIARDVLRAIAGLPGCRVVVGTRRDRDGRHDPGDRDRDLGPLIDMLRPRRAPLTVLDLGTDEHTGRDIEQYVESRLGREGVTGWPSPLRRRAAARAVADQARRVFLYARFAMRVLEGVSETVVDEAGWERRLPADVGDAGLHQVFAEDLTRFDDPTLVREVLTPLAFARGKGLPRRQIWPELAGALAADRSGRAYSSADVSRVIREAGWYLIEGTEDGQAVFRLYHQSIGDYLRGEVSGGGRCRRRGDDR
ncbi:caspase family protein [Streptomyces olivaceus]|uniref:caspase family protein n=1 Tax=Streptomyces olivaceus TaxID=47716 RepID=UPI001CCCF405|nr:caspase family protein [Streptomyces olivaceus]MBZ6195153.1 caspase family protein [Streptomyces olivaceus]